MLLFNGKKTTKKRESENLSTYSSQQDVRFQASVESLVLDPLPAPCIEKGLTDPVC